MRVAIFIVVLVVAGCAAERDRAGPRVVSTTPPAGAQGVDPRALAAIVWRFDAPVALRERAAARLTTPAGVVELPLSPSEDGVELQAAVGGQLVFGAHHEVALDGVRDVTGDAPAGDDAALAFDTRASDDAVAPRLVSSSPRRGQADVYPARLVGSTAPQVAIALRFDEAMDPTRASIAWGPAGGPRAIAAGTWSADRTELVVTLFGMPLAGVRPLADATAYEVDVRGLRDASYNAVAPDVGLEQGVLRFATTTYDPLLNHSCGHVFFGPYATAAAAASAAPTAARTDVAHTRYTVSLPAAGGATYAGFTRLRPAVTGTWHLFLDGPVALAAQTEAGAPVPVAIAPTPDACVGITHRATFHTTALEPLYLRLGPEPAASSRFIVEIVPDE